MQVVLLRYTSSCYVPRITVEDFQLDYSHLPKPVEYSTFVTAIEKNISSQSSCQYADSIDLVEKRFDVTATEYIVFGCNIKQHAAKVLDDFLIHLEGYCHS